MSLNRKVNNQDISYFLDLKRNNQLDLDPPFQRRSVWTAKDRRYFLDTIFRGYPSPSIYLSKNVREDGSSTFSVVDGKQRLETIVMFSEDKLVLRNYGDASIDGKPWSQVRMDRDLRRRFLDYVLPVEQLTVGDDLNEVFDRLNRNNKNLNAQELRHAKYDGWFLEFVESETEHPFWRQIGVVTLARARRMRDVQFLSELLIAVVKRDVVGFDQGMIDDFTAKYHAATNDDEDNDVDQSTEDLAARFYGVKRRLSVVLDHEGDITNYTKQFGHLYSLWALLCSHGEHETPPDFAARYLDFMRLVNDVQETAEVPPEGTGDHVWHYAINSRGASTDLFQRRARHDALRSLLHN